MNILDAAIGKITAQQPREHTAVWMVGEQLKYILRAEPHLAELVAQDLDMPEMALDACERKIKAFADANKPKGSKCFCVIPSEAERIIREFYGLPEAGCQSEPDPARSKNLIRLEDYL